MRRHKIYFCAFLFALAFSLPLRAASPSDVAGGYRRTLGIGFAYTGPLVRWGFKKYLSLEAHYLFGEADSTDGTVSASVIGMRGYRHFRTDQRLQFFAGPELAYVMADSMNLKSAGYVAGGFAGAEYYLTRRISVGFDAGPYYTYLKEKKTSVSESGVDFTVNTFLNFYIF